jgi:hypothetical protein
MVRAENVSLTNVENRHTDACLYNAQGMTVRNAWRYRVTQFITMGAPLKIESIDATMTVVQFDSSPVVLNTNQNPE